MGGAAKQAVGVLMPGGAHASVIASA